MEWLNDNIVINYCKENAKKNWKNREINIINYLLNRFNDFSVEDKYDKCRESLYRLKNNINKRPICPICNKYLTYSIKFKCYPAACSKDCVKAISIIKRRKTSLEKYGTDHPAKNNLVKEKQKQTNLKKYGTISALQNKEVQYKTKQTLIEKYGVENIAQSDYWKNNVNKTSLEKYGTLYPNQSKIVKNKIKETTYLHFGVDNYWKTEQNKLAANSKKSLLKMIETKRKNGTFNTSNGENTMYNKLLEIFPNVKREYRDKERYPWHCDFYIPELDLFIECNFHWTHGGHPYNPNNINDYNKLQKLQEKDSWYYKNVITTWTIRDVTKREIAKKNNLKYIEIFSINYIDEFINNILSKNFDKTVYAEK